MSSPRDVAGMIRRAKSIYVWVPYSEVLIVEEDDEEGGEADPAAPPEIVPIPKTAAEGDDPEIEDDEEEGEIEEIGVWLQVKRVQAREIIQHAYDDPDVEEIAVFESKGELYIGLGPEPE